MGEEEEDKQSDGHDSDLSVILLLLAGFGGLIGLIAAAVVRIPLPFACPDIKP